MRMSQTWDTARDFLNEKAALQPGRSIIPGDNYLLAIKHVSRGSYTPADHTESF